MSKLRIVFVLMSLVAIIIVGLAAYIFSHLNSLTATQGFILLGVAIAGLVLVLVVLLILFRSVYKK